MKKNITPESFRINRAKRFFELLRSKITSGSITELSWVFIGHLLNVVLAFAILKILSKMGTRDYGVYALVITISSLLSSAFYGPVLQGFIRFYYDFLERKLIRHYLSFVYRIMFVTGLIHFGAALAAGIAALFFNIGLAPLTVFFAGIYMLALRIGEFFNAFLSIIRKRKENSLLQGGERIFLTAALLFLLYSKELDLLPVFIIFTIAAALFTVIKLLVFKQFVPAAEDNLQAPLLEIKMEIRKKIITYTLPFLIWGFAAWMQLNGEKWIIAGLLSTSDVGIYAVMISLISAMVVFPNNILSEFTTPIIFQNYTDLTNRSKVNLGYTYIRINTMLVFLITLISTLLTALFGKEMILLISAPQYAVYSNLLPYLCMGIGLFYTGQALATLGLSLNRPEIYISPKIITGVLSIALNYLMIKALGITGTAYTALIIGVIYLIYIALVNRSILNSVKRSIRNSDG